MEWPLPPPQQGDCIHLAVFGSEDGYPHPTLGALSTLERANT